MLRIALACVGTIGFGACTIYERPYSAFDVTQHAYVTNQKLRIVKVGHVHDVPALYVPVRHPPALHAPGRVRVKCPELVVC